MEQLASRAIRRLAQIEHSFSWGRGDRQTVFPALCDQISDERRPSRIDGNGSFPIASHELLKEIGQLGPLFGSVDDEQSVIDLGATRSGAVAQCGERLGEADDLD